MINSGECGSCGREFEDVKDGAKCPSDDCPSNMKMVNLNAQIQVPVDATEQQIKEWVAYHLGCANGIPDNNPLFDEDNMHAESFDIGDFNLNNLHVVTGRFFGEDDDTCYVVEANTVASADSKFKEQLKNDAGATNANVDIITSETLKEAIEQRIR